MSQTRIVQTGLPGVFYRRPSPSEPLFIDEGSSVEEGETIGLVEIMKNFHPVVAVATGTLTRFLVENESEVAPGQEIAEIEVDA